MDIGSSVGGRCLVDRVVWCGQAMVWSEKLGWEKGEETREVTRFVRWAGDIWEER